MDVEDPRRRLDRIVEAEGCVQTSGNRILIDDLNLQRCQWHVQALPFESAKKAKTVSRRFLFDGGSRGRTFHNR